MEQDINLTYLEQVLLQFESGSAWRSVVDVITTYMEQQPSEIPFH